MVDDALRRIEEETGSPSRWSRIETLESLSDGLEELSDETEFYERMATIKLRRHATYFDLRTIGDNGFLRVTSVYNPTRGQWLEPTHYRDLDEKTARQWQTVAGEPDRWFVRGIWWLGFFPRPSATDGVVQIWGKSLHPRVTDESVRPHQLPEEYHQAVVEYAAYDLLAKDGETAKAMAHFSEYTERAAALRKRAHKRSSHARVGHLGMM